MPDNPKCPVCGEVCGTNTNGSRVGCTTCDYNMRRRTFNTFCEASHLASLIPKPEDGFEIVSGGGATGKGWKWYSVKCKQWLYCAEGEMVNELLLARPIAKESANAR